MEPSFQFDAEQQKQNAELQAELKAYNEQHGTHYNYPEDASALYYECEGGGIKRDELLNFPNLLKFWDGANEANTWKAENGVQATEDDDLPF